MKIYFILAGIGVVVIVIVLTFILLPHPSQTPNNPSPSPAKGYTEPPPPSMNPAYAAKIKKETFWTKLPYYTKNYSISYLDSAKTLVVTTYGATEADRQGYLQQAKQWIAQNGGNVDQLKIVLSPSWYYHFPFIQQLYTISYNLTDDKFYGTISPSKLVNISEEEQVGALKKEGVRQLQKMGVDTNKYSIEWMVNP